MRTLIKELSDRRELLLVDREVDPRFELAAVTKCVQKDGEQAVLFNKVAGTSLPVVSNLYGSHERLCRLIGAQPDSFCRTWLEILKRPVPHRIYDVQPESGTLSCAIHDLPAITYHEKDAGAYFTSAIYLAREPDSGVPNLSFHRSMLVNNQELRVRLGSSHDLAAYQRKAEQRGLPLEAALLIGVPPEIFLSACYSLPYDADELELAAKLAGRPLPMHKCRKIDLLVPADA